MLKKNRLRHFYSLGDQGVSSGTNLLASIILARALGVETFGIFSLYLIVLYIAIGVRHSLVNVSLVNDLGNASHNKYIPIIHKYTSLDFYIGLLITISLIILCVVIELTGSNVIYWASLIPLFWGSNEFCRRAFYGLKKEILGFVITFVRSVFLIASLAEFYFSSTPKNIEYALGIYAASSLLTTIIAYYFLSKTVRLINLKSSCARELWKETRGYSKWLFYSSIVNLFKEHFVSIASAGVFGTSFIGGLRVAQTLMGVFQTVYMSLENIIPIRASELFNKDGRQSTIFFLLKAYCLVLISFFPFLFVLFTFSKDILIVIFGDQFGGAGYILKFFIVIHLIYFSQYMLSILYRVIQKPKGIFISALASSVTTVIVFTPLISLFGEVGAFYVMLLSSILGLMLGITYLFFQTKNQLTLK